MHTTDGSRRNILDIEGLDVFYGKAHALQQVSLSLHRGVLAVVGRNGMGKTTLCKAITGMVPGRGSVRFDGKEVLGLPPNIITRLGVAYVPQGRRVWRSLTVDETLRLSATTARKGSWTVERVYQVFPRLAERRSNGGAQLSGGEQQMLAIGRALLFNPRLLVMDEPTEGLAPVIVEHVATMLRQLAEEGSISVLLIEQNLGVALEVADRIAIMVNGRIAHELPAAELASDKALQQRLLGLKAGASDAANEATIEGEGNEDGPAEVPGGRGILRVVRSYQSRPDHAAGRLSLDANTSGDNTGEYGSASQVAPARNVVYLIGAFGPVNAALACMQKLLGQKNLSVVSVDIGGHHDANALVGCHEVMGYGIRLDTALAHYVSSRNDMGAVVFMADAQSLKACLAAGIEVKPGVPKTVVAEQVTGIQVSDMPLIQMPLKSVSALNEQILAGLATGISGSLVSPARTSDTAQDNSSGNSNIQRIRRTQS